MPAWLGPGLFACAPKVDKCLVYYSTRMTEKNHSVLVVGWHIHVNVFVNFLTFDEGKRWNSCLDSKGI